jgi:hypothetical protein
MKYYLYGYQKVNKQPPLLVKFEMQALWLN